MKSLKGNISVTKDDLFRAAINKHMALSKLTKRDLAETLRISYSAFCYKYNNPNKFTLFEARSLSYFLDFDNNEKIELM